MAVFSKILIANRGEIAARVIRTAKALGYRTVAVYSEADANARHVQLADQAVCIGPAPVGQSYLLADNIIAAAKKSGADAIHPGYGFLSENADFARTCVENDIVFIGPPTDAIELMGSKRLSKIAMIEAGVPCIPGYEGDIQDPDHLIGEAKRIGFPLMIKASAGGGGRGMRLVFEESQLADNIKSAKSEALNAFGNGELILERAVIQPRHIEIQVFADQHGNAVYLGERDCSIQRRHQKVVEEAPSPALDEALRQQMGVAAVNAAKSCQYVGAGTVEFLLDNERNFYFLEMNTRLQVEHPVTELITGTDLVEWQIRVASGEPLPLTQEQITLNGHAIEVRLYAEDPTQQFLPQTGPVLKWSIPERDGIRIDHGVVEGTDVSPHYDPMLAKIIAYGRDREDATRRLITAVEDTVLLGVNSNKTFLANILRNSVFRSGEATTAFIADHFQDDSSIQAKPADSVDCAIAGTLLHILSGQRNSPNPGFVSWRSTAPVPSTYQLVCGDHQCEVKVTPMGNNANDTYVVTTLMGEASDEHQFKIASIKEGVCSYIHNDVLERIHFAVADETIYLDTSHGNQSFVDITHAPAVSADGAGSGRINAPMDGAIVEIAAKVGDTVSKGQIVAVLEAMKMEHQLKADVDGVVESVSVGAGIQVKNKQLLIAITPHAS